MTSKVKARICFAGLVCALALLLTSCDFHIMSKREVEEYLEKRYDKEFTVLSSEYHSYLWISFDPVFPEDLTEICELLSRTFADTLEKIPGAQDERVSTRIRIWYRDHDWPDEKYCFIWIEPFAQYEWNKETGKSELISFDLDADAIREYILDEVGEYKERLQQAGS